MTGAINPGYAKRIFDELPGRTRNEKAASLRDLCGLLRDERDRFKSSIRRPRTMAELAPSISGKRLAELAKVNVLAGGLSIPVTALMNAYLIPDSALHDLARATFDAEGLTVATDPAEGRGRPVTRLVKKAQIALDKVRASRKQLEASWRSAPNAPERT